MENEAFSNATVYGGSCEDSNATVYGGNCGDSNATVYSSSGDVKKSVLENEQIFDGRYKIISNISGESSQAMVYLTENTEDGSHVVVKIYNTDFKPDYGMLEKFKKIDSPYLAKLLNFGSCQGKHYEVYKYYKNGNVLQKAKKEQLSAEFIENVAIVSMNEALHTLHNMGIVHADVKPENILIGDDEQSLVLGDYGISVQLDSDGCAYRELQGTLAYAPRAEQHFNKIKIEKAWDFGSMGLVLITLICGRGLFDGMNNDEIFREWERGIEIPSVITGRLKSLILGLIEQDSDKRFGYNEVVRWCEGDIVKTGFSKKVNIVKNIQPLIVAIVDGKVITVNTPGDFAREILKNWNAARDRIFDNPSSKSIIENFLRQFDGTYYDSVKSHLDYIDKDKTLFCTAYTILPHKDIYYKGKYLGRLDSLFSAENISENAEELLTFVKSDLLEFYLEVNEYPDDVMDSIKALIRLAGNDGQFLYYLLMYSFAKEKVLMIDEFEVSSIEALSDAVIGLGIEKVLDEKYRPQLYAWLYCMGYGNEVNMMRRRDNNE